MTLKILLTSFISLTCFTNIMIASERQALNKKELRSLNIACTRANDPIRDLSLYFDAKDFILKENGLLMDAIASCCRSSVSNDKDLDICMQESTKGLGPH